MAPVRFRHPRPRVAARGALCALILALPAASAEAATPGFERDLTPPRATGAAARAKPKLTSPVARIADLAARHPRLTTAQRRAAAPLLARPTDGTTDPGGNGWKVAEA